MREHCLAAVMLKPASSVRALGYPQARVVVTLGLTQWIAWGSTYYLVTVIATSVAAETGWSLTSVVAGLSFGLVIAGLVSPAVGTAIERHGGKPVLAAGSLLMAMGLIALGLARTRLSYYGAWSVLGVGMSAGLYDAVFAALGRLYGAAARGPIGNLTLIGGLAMSATWPLSAYLMETLGWRGACFVYAALHLAIGLPLLLRLPPVREIHSQTEVDAVPAAHGAIQTAAPHRCGLLLWLLGINLTLQIVVGSMLAVHLLSLLQGDHLPLAVAVSLGSVMGACQIGGRLIEVSLARRVHPSLEGVVASALVFAGLALLAVGAPSLVTVAIIVYGLGNGVRTIVKGTLPLALFGSDGYAGLIGRLGLPTQIAQAVGPTLGALVLTRYGVTATLSMLALLALANLLVSGLLHLGSPARAVNPQSAADAALLAGNAPNEPG